MYNMSFNSCVYRVSNVTKLKKVSEPNSKLGESYLQSPKSKDFFSETKVKSGQFGSRKMQKIGILKHAKKDLLDLGYCTEKFQNVSFHI